MKKVIVFGVFDGFHEGHRHFLHEASRHGDHLIVVVARDEVAEELKGRRPRFSLEERMRTIEEAHIAHVVKQGDRVTGSWQIIRHTEPDIVATGHDQEAIRQSLMQVFPEEGRPFGIVRLAPHKPDEYSSTKLFHTGR